MIPVPSITTFTLRTDGDLGATHEALTMITTSCAANLASRRSRSAPPIMAKIDICCGTIQTPLRSSPPRIAMWLSLAGPGTTSGDGPAAGPAPPGADARAGRA